MEQTSGRYRGPLLTQQVHDALRAAARAGAPALECSLDLDRSMTTVEVSGEGWSWQGRCFPYLASCKDRTIYYWSDQAFLPVAHYSTALYKLVPTHWGPPTFEIDGIKMLPTAQVSPYADAERKVGLIEPHGKLILDTCGGLGYYAACCLQAGAKQVLSYEKTADVIWLRSLNPWSPEVGAGLTLTPFILHVNAAFPAKNMAELIAHVKANPGKFNIASSGIGATNHLIAEMLKQQAGLDLTHVPYKGGAQAGQDVAGGQAQMMFSAALEARPLLASGRTRAIAITSAERSPAFPEIPTVVEATGMKEFVVTFWQGMVVLAGTPKAIVDKLEKAIAKVAAEADMIERFKPQGVEIRASTQAEFKDYMGREEVRWVRLIKERNIKPE